MERVEKHRITREEFSNLFWGFRDLVEDYRYEKLKYSIWRDLREEIPDNEEFILEFVYRDKNLNIVEITAEDTGNDYILWDEDGSFGEYLFDEFTLPVKTINNSNENKKENKEMKFNFDFGPVNNAQVRMSMYGLAVKNTDGVWVSYDSNGNQVMDVDILNFDGGDFLYRIPVAVKDIAAGDVVIHGHKPMFVTKVNNNHTIEVVDVCAGEAKSILPTKNMFGFDFMTKVVSLINFGTATEDNPFGNVLPFMFLANKDGGKRDNNTMMMLAMSGAFGGKGGFDFASNPFALMALCGDGLNDNLALAMLMAQNQTIGAAAPACQCDCNCGKTPEDVGDK